MPVDYVYRVDQPHERGQLATVCAAIADGGGLIGDIVTVNMGRDRSIREISVEVTDDEAARQMMTRLDAIDGVRVINAYDRALHVHEGGKIEVTSRAQMKTLQDSRDVYTPGVARVCEEIAADPHLASRYTMIGRTIAICTNGTRVLGLGKIGPVASMPVMEGKAMFYRLMAGISAFPILIDTADADEFVETVIRIAPGFGGIHLEDIAVPECFEIEARLIEVLDIPVMHDDVHGTAVAAVAAALVACDQAGRHLSDSTVGQIGLGAAGLGIATLMVQAGAKRVLASDPDEGSHARARQRGIEISEYSDLMSSADVIVATTGVEGLIKPADVKLGQIILALTNPNPEIRPSQALAAGATFAADGSMVNNAIGFPGIFRGALASGATEISTGMKLAAARAIAGLTKESELVPDALDPSVHMRVDKAVEAAAREEGLANPARVPLGL